MSVMATRPILRWALPAGVLVAVLGGGVVSTQLRAAANVTLPTRSPAQLMVDVQGANLTGVSGTVVEKADLGLPALPDSLGGDGSSQLNSLISGSHTLRVWYSGPDKTRVALLGAVGESDIIRNGNDAWIWSSSGNSAAHFTMNNGASDSPDSAGSANPGALPTLSNMPTTPQQAATQALAMMGKTTSVSTEPGTQVAGRSAYVLSIAPKDTDSLIARIRVAIDGVAHVPTQVEVFAKGHPDAAAFSIGFSQVDFARPDDDRFAFTPPAGAKVTDETSQQAQALHQAAKPTTAIIGSGWTSVLAARLPDSSAKPTAGSGDAVPGMGAGAGAGTKSGMSALNGFISALPQVNGVWGSGRLLQSRLFSVLITDDGRVLVGAVSGDQLQKAAADPAAALR
jgi:outer membrane lipoprotein-sorting protein